VIDMPDNFHPTDQAPGAIRLIFEYDGDDVRLIHQQTVDVLVTGFDAAAEIRAGRFAEVRDAEDRSLARVAIRHDASSREVFPENPGEPITRVDVERPQGAFTVVVPAPPAARQVALLDVETPAPPPGEPPERGVPSPPAAPREHVVGVFPLDAGEPRP
jgi:hypothetical protein